MVSSLNMGIEQGFFGRDHRITVSNRKEQYCLSRALREFIGEEVRFDLHDNPNGTFTFTGLPKDIAVSFIEYDVQRKEWNDPFFDFIADLLPDHDHDSLKTFSDNSRIAMVRRLKPDPRFKGIIKKHALAYHHGALSFTELRLAQVNEQLHNGNGIFSHRASEEDVSLRRLLSFSHQAIAWYPLTHIPSRSKMGRIFRTVNALSDIHELSYHVDLVMRDLTYQKSQKSGVAVGMGVALEPVLENLSRTFGDQTAQISSQLFGEVVSMAIAAGDRIPGIEHEKSLTATIERYFGIAAQTLHLLPAHMQAVILAKSAEYQKLRRLLLQRSAILALTLSATVSLSHLSYETNSLAPYALIPFLNTAIITAYEMYERTREYQNVNITDEQFEELLSQIPDRLQKVYKKLPRSAALAFVDFAKNKYALGSLTGSLLATLLVLPLDNMGVLREWIYATSGVIAENATAVAFGFSAARQDPYKEFLKDLGRE